MKKYILKRILLSILVIFAVVSITFIIARMLPSDPAAKWAGARATQEQLEQFRRMREEQEAQQAGQGRGGRRRR